jgi:hypothetical protein
LRWVGSQWTQPRPQPQKSPLLCIRADVGLGESVLGVWQAVTGTQFIHNNPRSLPLHYGFGIPGVNAPGIPGVTCNAGAVGPRAGIGRPGISGASGGRSSGGSPSVGKTGSPQKPSGAMWSLQKLVGFITLMYSLHNPGGLGAGDVTPSGQRHVQLRAPIPAPPNAKLPPPLAAPRMPLTPKPPASQCICEPLIRSGSRRSYLARTKRRHRTQCRDTGRGRREPIQPGEILTHRSRKIPLKRKL